MLGGPVRLLRCPPTVAGHRVATGRQRFADLPRLWSQTPRRALAPRGCPASRFAVSCRCLLLAHHHAYDPGIPENRSTTRVPPGQSRFSSRPPRSRVLSTYSAPPCCWHDQRPPQDDTGQIHPRQAWSPRPQRHQEDGSARKPFAGVCTSSRVATRFISWASPIRSAGGTCSDTEFQINRSNVPAPGDADAGERLVAGVSEWGGRTGCRRRR